MQVTDLPVIEVADKVNTGTHQAVLSTEQQPEHKSESGAAVVIRGAWRRPGKSRLMFYGGGELGAKDSRLRGELSAPGSQSWQ